MDVGSIFSICRYEDLIHHFNDLAGGFIMLVSRVLIVLLLLLEVDIHHVELTRVIIFHFCGAFFLALEKVGDRVSDVLFDAHKIIDFSDIEQRRYRVCFEQIFGVIDKNIHHAFRDIPAQRHPAILDQEGLFQTGQQLVGDLGLFINLFERAFVEQGQGFSDLLLFYPELFHQDELDAFLHLF